MTIEACSFADNLPIVAAQLIGFGLSGLTYKILVRPTAMVWPYTLVVISLFETLHGSAKEHVAETKDRLRFFTRAFSSIFAWQWLPSVIWPGLSSVAVLCLMNNRSWILTTLGSGYEGFGMFDFSLDWSVVGGTGALYTPWPAAVCFYVGLVVNMWFITPMLYFSNWWDAQTFDSPMGKPPDQPSRFKPATDQRVPTSQPHIFTTRPTAGSTSSNCSTLTSR